MPPPLLPAALQPSPQTLRYTLNLLKASFLYHFITEYAFDIRETAGPSSISFPPSSPPSLLSLSPTSLPSSTKPNQSPNQTNPTNQSNNFTIVLPTISIAGDSVLISKHYRRGRGIAVGDMVSVRHPIMPAEGAIKRVLGLPGDFVVQELEMEQGGVGDKEEGRRGQMIMIQVCVLDE